MAAQEPDHRRAAILSADASGALRSEITRLVEGHRGRVVGPLADAVLAEFPTALDAVTSAVEIQRALRARNAGQLEAQRLELRIGVHVGDVRADGDRLVGEGVSIAAQLERLADPGGIWVSEPVRNQARECIPVSFEAQGERELDGADDPVPVYRIRLDVPESVVRPPEPRRRIPRWSLAAGVAVVVILAVALLRLVWR